MEMCATSSAVTCELRGDAVVLTARGVLNEEQWMQARVKGWAMLSPEVCGVVFDLRQAVLVLDASEMKQISNGLREVVAVLGRRPVAYVTADVSLPGLADYLVQMAMHGLRARMFINPAEALAWVWRRGDRVEPRRVRGAGFARLTPPASVACP
ncbi:hypothetical protein [Azohydromonas aeria]|uniref:hypothetical protein n=1 Tax=Azohydromonas aeria TaxID=2590212 RepID=UPI0012F720E6|nr:hypothetical protein [Azohydromonas aeria]